MCCQRYVIFLTFNTIVVLEESFTLLRTIVKETQWFYLFNFIVCATTDAKTTSNNGYEYAVPDPNKECVFPFEYKGLEYTKCTNNSACPTCFWCGTQYGVTDTAGWGLCNTICPKGVGMLFY